MPADAAEAKRRHSAQTPSGRLGRPPQVAKMVALLAFEATFTTGAGLVTGGAAQLRSPDRCVSAERGARNNRHVGSR